MKDLPQFLAKGFSFQETAFSSYILGFESGKETFQSMKTHYSEAEALPKLVFLDGWAFKNNGIEKSFEFRDFVEAFAFMTKIAMEAERANHHPDWKNVYNKVHIRLSTHEVGGLTDKDFQLADHIEKRILRK